jgi:hypothetical protein
MTTFTATLRLLLGLFLLAMLAGPLVRSAAANTPPVANEDVYSTPQGTTLTVDPPGVLANDADADGDRLTATLVAGTAHGTLDLGLNGLFIYMPDGPFFGDDSFTYQVTDGSTISTVATVTITVVPASNPPIAADNAYVVGADLTLAVDAASGVLANDADPDGDALQALFELGSGPSHGAMNFFGQDGSFAYTPFPGFVGTDSFQYQAVDSVVSSNLATVTITVVANTPPVAADDSFTVARDDHLVVAAPGVLANDGDADGDTLGFLLETSPSHGTLSVAADNAFTYLPNASFVGTDSFQYRAVDARGSQSNVATVTITVIKVNHAPVAVGDAYGVAKGRTLVVKATEGVLANDSDYDGDPLQATVVTATANGILVLKANGSFVYTPKPGFAGSDTFTYVATDGAAQSAPTTVTITVKPKG